MLKSGVGVTARHREEKESAPATVDCSMNEKTKLERGKGNGEGLLRVSTR